jgi:hypothetical protein
MVCLYTTDKSTTAYIRTDQLDGETDWKLRKAPPSTQKYQSIHFFLYQKKLVFFLLDLSFFKKKLFCSFTPKKKKQPKIFKS